MTISTEHHVESLLRIGDTALVLAQRLSEWVGSAPTLEEELALANVALDVLGGATMVLDHAAAVEGRARSGDELAFLRDSRSFHNLLLVELPNGDFATTIVRQLLHDAWAIELWTALQQSSDETLAAIAGKAVKETAYHLEHSGDWFVRLADGTDESRRRIDAAIELLWPYSGEAFIDDEVDRAAAAAGIVPLGSSLQPAWRRRLEALAARVPIELPFGRDIHMQSGGRQGLHTEHHGYILAEMQFLQRAYPGATW